LKIFELNWIQYKTWEQAHERTNGHAYRQKCLTWTPTREQADEGADGNAHSQKCRARKLTHEFHVTSKEWKYETIDRQ